ncbi:SDR family oxidoreductase [Kosakonia cowanii]|jgi:NAD(P)-dependent dehydrogenase (short-subunit alcohol dehydrogenase family)|uniref:SDR family oxidoreductase n=1 Tax=Kosakonia cowanii TaxID=208223 RepID=UPI000FEC9BED|nr:SDR family oxidoreductase [Kosakonia cowanii]MDP9769635.1 NAD(P)-dependent dehydrogenase (short-subunit alcohol dehydrogenase family) [Atlantibacter hermannii]QAR47206.1 SDR family oxidoreductase [Kosakonia cowanii]TPD66363.1 SDR family oxidoreductase [Kosakonia cowanii]TPD89900.1 SDR family oxidoreductase [Kosakonia cowanii]TPE06208.1 SDR family oxidoreductase [Kosakonia cowanii]
MQKTVLITGCSSGIGLESARELKRQGFRVLAACRKADDVARMDQEGFTGVLLDLDDAASVDRAADEVIALTGNRLYGLFNNAGYGVYGSLDAISREQLEQQFSSNFFGTHQLTLRLLPAMLPHGEGRIVMTSSVMGLISTPGRGAYAASKYALEAWSDALRMELRHTGIKVSLIEPGPIRTRFTDNVNQTQRDKPVENPGIAARFTLGPEAVVAKVRHAFESKHPKLRYPVTLVTWAVSLLKRLLPARMMDKILHG